MNLFHLLLIYHIVSYYINFLAAVEQVFKIGSMEPGAMLFDASKEFEVSSFHSVRRDYFPFVYVVGIRYKAPQSFLGMI